MRLVLRLTIYLLIPIGLVFALDSFLTLRSDLKLLDVDTRRDDATLVRELAIAVEETWRDAGEQAAVDLVSRFPAMETGIETRIVYLEDVAGPAGVPTVPEAAAKLSRDVPTVQLRAQRSAELRLFTYLRLDAQGSRRAALEISEPVSHERDHLAARIPKKLVSAAAMLLLCAGVAWAVGVRVVGRPVEMLIVKARRIGGGDFSTPLSLRSRDELSSLAREMNAMAEMLEASRRRLEDESAARIAAVEQLRHADRLTTVGRLASGLAHELGTPLNVVAGRAQMIASGECTGREEVARAARVIGDQADRMTRIVRQLLGFARHRSGERTESDLSKLARETATFLEPLARKRGVRLACAPDRELVVRVDAAQIQQALTNLVVNAIHASRPDGVVEIRVEAREVATPSTPGHESGRYAVLEVEDHGEGIPDDALPAIFDPFFTTKPVGEGTGLGLAVVHGILEEHRGWIEVRTEPGCGSCFSAFVPAGGADEPSNPDRR
ncbi:MAG: sensor histidine kinase [Gaiellaceae bacterium]